VNRKPGADQLTVTGAELERLVQARAQINARRALRRPHGQWKLVADTSVENLELDALRLA
jgi:hypothetical protein